MKQIINQLNRKEKKNLITLPAVFILLVMFCGWFAAYGIFWMDSWMNKTFPEFNPHTAVMQMKHSHTASVQIEK